VRQPRYTKIGSYYKWRLIQLHLHRAEANVGRHLGEDVRQFKHGFGLSKWSGWSESEMEIQ
jgi:hypothetical protein